MADIVKSAVDSYKAIDPVVIESGGFFLVFLLMFLGLVGIIKSARRD